MLPNAAPHLPIVPEYYTASPDWAGETAAIVASGLSIENEDLEGLSSCRVVAVNAGFLFWPKADVLMSGDWDFFVRFPDLSAYEGPLIVCPDARAWERGAIHDRRCVPMRHGGRRKLSGSPDAVAGARSGVTQALNFLRHKAVSRILLLGVDCVASPDRRRRAGTNDHEPDDGRMRYGLMAATISQYVEQMVAVGVDVINCSPVSRVVGGRRMTLAQALEEVSL